jgi:hypothetical protein
MSKQIYPSEMLDKIRRCGTTKTSSRTGIIKVLMGTIGIKLIGYLHWLNRHTEHFLIICEEQEFKN